jgi:hypothetical protein
MKEINLSMAVMWLLFEASIFLPMARQPLGGLGRHIFEASRSHTDTSHSVGPLWTSDQPDAENSQYRRLYVRLQLCTRHARSLHCPLTNKDAPYRDVIRDCIIVRQMAALT